MATKRLEATRRRLKRTKLERDAVASSQYVWGKVDVPEGAYPWRWKKVKNMDKRLEALRERIQRDQEKLLALERKKFVANRKLETRAKILIGAAMLSDMQKHKDLKPLINSVLTRVIKLDRDVALLQRFGFLEDVKLKTPTE